MNSINLNILHRLLDNLTDHINYALFDIAQAEVELTDKSTTYELNYIATRLRALADSVQKLRENYQE